MIMKAMVMMKTTQMMMLMIDDNGWTRAAVQHKISNILLSCTDRANFE